MCVTESLPGPRFARTGVLVGQGWVGVHSVRRPHWAGWDRRYGAEPSISAATVQNKGSANFFSFLVKDQIENILCFMGHTAFVRPLAPAIDDT